MTRTAVVVVPRHRAEDARRALARAGAIDASARIRKEDGNVILPLRGPSAIDVTRFDARLSEAEVDARPIPVGPGAGIRKALEAARVPHAAVPHRWDRLGDVVIVRLAPAARPYGRIVGRVLAEALRARTVVEDVSGVHGPFRVPDVRVLWGDGTETVHTEGGVRFSLDVARVMFASGNMAMRMALPSKIPAGSVVVDLFAGIGYFAIPIAVRSRAARVYACEANPVAFHYLVENARRNRASSLVPLPGDCREVAPAGVADWVLLGHFDALRFADVALRCLRGRGTLVLHHLAPRESFPDRIEAAARAAIDEAGGTVESVVVRKVKSYAPGIFHVALEVGAMAIPKEFSGGASSTRSVTR